MSQKAKRIILIWAVVILALIIFGSVESYISRQHGSVVVKISMITDSNTQSLKLSFNNKSYPVSSLNSTYQLHRGSYVLDITKPGFKAFSTTFNLSTGNNLIINAALQLSSAPTTLSLSNLTIPLGSAGVSITNVVYFYSNTWAIVYMSQDQNSAGIAVAQYDAANQSWSVAIGPGTYFPSSSVQNLPTQVQEYLYSNNFAVEVG
jgi:hypothetical protein